MYPPLIQKLIDLFSKFPTVGPKTAARFVFHLLKSDNRETDDLIFAISNLKRNIKTCSFCFKSFESKQNGLCEICSNNARDKTLLCVVEKETDLQTLENIKKYKGRYFILGGVASTLKKQNDIRIEQLKQRIKNAPEIQEIILATNSTSEGEATALFLQRELADFNKKITRLAKGLPVGGELEYADEDTLKSALEQRK